MGVTHSLRPPLSTRRTSAFRRTSIYIKSMKVGESSRRRRQKRKSKSVRAELEFPVGRIGRYLRKGRYAKRVGETAPVYMAAVMEYIAAEVLFMAGYKARGMKKKRITPRHIALVMRDDEDISQILRGVVIPNSGVHIEKPAEKPPTKKKSEEP